MSVACSGQYASAGQTLNSINLALTKNDIYAQFRGSFVTRIQRSLPLSPGEYFVTGGSNALYSPLVRQVAYILFV
ncbi:hypothetical protein EMIT0158MI4_20640 [Burkholderia ambifaria]